MSEQLGKWAFIIGLIVAVLAGFITTYATYTLLILFVLGLVVGFINITEKIVIKFLVAVIALLSLGVGSLNALGVLGIVNSYLMAILGNFISFVGAAALVVSIKAIIDTGKP